MSSRQDSRVFGQRRKHHTIIFASGETVRHVTVRPWLAGLGLSIVGVMAIGYLVATSYLVLRDDLMGAAAARQARMQHAYEDRIAALRAQVDRVTSRQLLDQQLMETKVAELLERQNALAGRQGKLGPLLERLGANTATPVPAARPEKQASNETERPAGKRLAALAHLPNIITAPESGPVNAYAPALASTGESVGERADRIFSTVTLSLKSIERDQIEKIQGLAADAFETASRIGDTLKSAGLPAPAINDSAVGGPFIKPTDPNAFEASLDDLDEALTVLDEARKHARSLPLAIPAPGAEMTSGFGTRSDPFLRRPAFHSGLDFRTPTGTPIYTAGAGTVISAGRNGGYGNMIEIDHGNGLTTRYAHLSRILVKKGTRVAAGSVIGKAGSTGRSTGPHLHYEVRRNGKPLNPARFVKLSREITPLLVSR